MQNGSIMVASHDRIEFTFYIWNQGDGHCCPTAGIVRGTYRITKSDGSYDERRQIRVDRYVMSVASAAREPVPKRSAPAGSASGGLFLNPHIHQGFQRDPFLMRQASNPAVKVAVHRDKVSSPFYFSHKSGFRDEFPIVSTVVCVPKRPGCFKICEVLRQLDPLR